MVGNEIHRHDDITLHLEYGTFYFQSDPRAPRSLVSQVAAITDEHGGLACDFRDDVEGVATAQDERRTSPRQRYRHLSQALEHECELLRQNKQHKYRLIQAIGILNSVLKGWIVRFALRLLHPVEHIMTVANWKAVVKCLNSFWFNHRN
jgi:hypothetical protein